MPLNFREPTPADYDALIAMLVASFEPISWYRRLDATLGPLNGRTWDKRFEDRVRDGLKTQTAWIGEDGGAILTYTAGSYDERSRAAFLVSRS